MILSKEKREMHKRILALALPNIISNISVPLLSSVDTAVVGRMEGAHFLGAIAIGAMIFNFLYWGFGFLRMGTTGMTAQAHGAEDQGLYSRTLYLASAIALGLGIILIAIHVPVFRFAFSVINADPLVEQFAQSYAFIRIWGAPAVLLNFVLQGWFLGMQNAKIPMILTLGINGSNIVLNLFFVYGLGMNSDGVAWGTLLSNYLGLLGGIGIVLWKFRSKLTPFTVHIFSYTEEIKRFFSVNRDIFIRTLGLIITYAFFTTTSAEMGTKILAANTILMQLWYLMAYGVDGFAFAAESLTGKYVGQKNKSGFKHAFWNTSAWGFTLGLLFTLLYAFADQLLLGFFTDQPEVIETALVFYGWTIIAPLLNTACFMLDGVFLGATATKPMRNSMIISTVLIFFPTFYLLEPWIHAHAIWAAMSFYMIARGATLSLSLPKLMRQFG